MHLSSRGKVLICCHWISTCPLFLSLSLFLALCDPCCNIFFNEFLYPDNRPDSSSCLSCTLAFIVLEGLGEGHITLFHLQMLTDSTPALIMLQPGPSVFISDGSTRRMRCCLQCQREELFITQGRLGPLFEYPKITLPRQNGCCHSAFNTGSGGWERPSELNDIEISQRSWELCH